jgi:hypothetical protein
MRLAYQLLKTSFLLWLLAASGQSFSFDKEMNEILLENSAWRDDMYLKGHIAYQQKIVTS